MDPLSRVLSWRTHGKSRGYLACGIKLERKNEMSVATRLIRICSTDLSHVKSDCEKRQLDYRRANDHQIECGRPAPRSLIASVNTIRKIQWSRHTMHSPFYHGLEHHVQTHGCNSSFFLTSPSSWFPRPIYILWATYPQPNFLRSTSYF